MSSCFNWAKFLMFYVTVNEKELFYRACLLVFWFYRHNLTHPSGSLSLCFTSEQVLHPYPCTLQDSVESCWKLSLKTTRNVSFQCHEKHRHYRSHISLMPSAQEKTRGKDCDMPAAMSSVSFTQSVFLFHCFIPRQGCHPGEQQQCYLNCFLQWSLEHKSLPSPGSCLETPCTGLSIVNELLTSLLLWPTPMGNISCSIICPYLMLSACGIL